MDVVIMNRHVGNRVLGTEGIANCYEIIVISYRGNVMDIVVFNNDIMSRGIDGNSRGFSSRNLKPSKSHIASGNLNIGRELWFIGYIRSFYNDPVGGSPGT